MASNNIFQYYKVDGGTDLTSDTQFSALGTGTKLIYKPSGEKYIKNSNYSNVFDKTDTFGELENGLKANAVGRIENTNNPDGTTNYYSIDGTKLGSFKSGVSPNDLNSGLNAVRSASIAKIDDADGNGVCSCKNNNNTQIDTFTCHISKTSNNPTLSWGQTSTIGTIDGTPLTVKMPTNPNTDTKYSAGTGLILNGATFYIDESWLKTFIDGSSGYTKGERYGDKWYIYGSGDGLGSSSNIYSKTVIWEPGSSGCTGYHESTIRLSGNHPPSGTYYCEIIGYNSNSNISSCYIYSISYN